MESLLEIQQKVKELENSLKNITNTIGSINTDIQKLRDTDKDLEIDFKKLKVLARHIPFKTHPLSELNDRHCIKLYVEILMNIIRISPETSVEKMSFVQWIIEKSKIDISFEDLYKESLEMNDKLLDEIVNYLSEDYKIYLIIDSMVIGNLTGQADVNTLNYIADICRVLGMKKDDINALAIISKAVLCQNADKLSTTDTDKILKYIKKVNYYIDKKVIEKIMIKYRYILEHTDDFFYFEYELKTFDYINKGDYIAVRKRGTELNSLSSFGQRHTNIIYNNIVAPVSGILYIYIYGKKEYSVLKRMSNSFCVISCKEDDEESIKLWLAKEKNIDKNELYLIS